MSKTVKRDKIGDSSDVPKTEWGIQDFYSLAQQVDFARLHQFRIVEWKHNLKPVFDESKFHLYLETASLPGKEITNVTVPYIGMEFNVPCMVKYSGSAYTITLRCDQFYIIRQALETCITNTYDDETTKAYGLVPSEDSYMIIALIGKSTQPISKYKLIGTSVSNTGTIQYNTGDAGTIAKVDMTLSYHYWRQLPETSESSDASDGASQESSVNAKQNLKTPAAAQAATTKSITAQQTLGKPAAASAAAAKSVGAQQTLSTSLAVAAAKANAVKSQQTLGKPAVASVAAAASIAAKQNLARRRRRRL